VLSGITVVSATSSYGPSTSATMLLQIRGTLVSKLTSVALKPSTGLITMTSQI
jgi:hypothetical protein